MARRDIADFYSPHNARMDIFARRCSVDRDRESGGRLHFRHGARAQTT